MSILFLKIRATLFAGLIIVLPGVMFSQGGIKNAVSDFKADQEVNVQLERIRVCDPERFAALSPAEIKTIRQKELRKIQLTDKFMSRLPVSSSQSRSMTQTSAVNISDSLALLALFNATGGPNWYNNTNWLTGPVSSWYGVGTANGKVTYIFLVNNNLYGALPDEIGNLDDLIELNLGSNQLNGNLPASIGELINLQFLILKNNQLSGTIPYQIGNIPNVNFKYIDLSFNQLTGELPVEFTNLINVYLIDISNNQLCGSIPVEMCNIVWSDVDPQFVYYNNYFNAGSCPAILCLEEMGIWMAGSPQLNGLSFPGYCITSPDVEIGFEQDWICNDGSGYYFGSVSAGYNASIEWYAENSDGYFINQNTLNPTYFPGSNDYSAGFVEIKVMVTNYAGWAEDSMTLNFQTCSVPMVIGLDDVWTCTDGSGYYFGSVSTQNYWNFQWYTTNGTGFFDDPYFSNPTYYPGEDDYMQGSVEIMVDAFGNNGPFSEFVTIHFMPQPCSLPVEIIQHERLTCADNYAYTIWDINYNGTWMVEWFIIDGSGYFDNEWSFYPVYYPSTQDYLNGFVILGVTVDSENGAAQDYLVLNFQYPPFVTAGPDTTINSGESLTLSEAEVTNGSFWYWSTSGDGNFSNIYDLNPVYTPGTGDITTGQVNLCLNASDGGVCSDVQDCILLDIENNSGTTDSCQYINILSPGWHGLSSFIDLSGKPVSEVMNPVIEKLTAIIDEEGNVYIPSMGINTIGDWENKGYKALFSDTCTIPVYGQPMQETVFPVEGPFTFVPIPVPDNDISTFDLLSEFSNQISLLLDMESMQMWWPAAGLFTLQALQPGNAYLIKTTESTTSFLVEFSTVKKNSGLFENPAPEKNSNPAADLSDSTRFLLNLPEINIIPTETTICSGEYFTFAGLTEGTNYSDIFWFTTNGNGQFSSNNILWPDYFPAISDMIQGIVEIYVYVSNGAGEYDYDHFTLYIKDQPTVYAGDNATVNAGESFEILTSYGENYLSLNWQSMGDGMFDDPGNLHPVYTPGITDVFNGSVELCINAEHPPCMPAISCMNLSILQNFNPDSLALVALYNATGGSDWFNNTNWLTGPVNTWYGVTISDAIVSGIHLPNNNLVGVIPPEIGNLSGLTYMILSGNELSGSIPAEIGNLASLNDLILDYNMITAIPPEIGNLTSLWMLDVNFNQITAIPTEIENIQSLRYAYFGHNQITSIPPEIFNLELLALYLNHNQIISIPSEIGNFVLYGTADFSHNLISSIPVEIGNMGSHSPNFYFQNNLISEIPEEMGNLDIVELDLSNNLLTGGVPDRFFYGEYLNLSNNYLTEELPLYACTYTNLDEFQFHNNNYEFNSCPAIDALLQNGVFIPNGMQRNGNDLLNDCVPTMVEIGVETDTVCADSSAYTFNGVMAQGYDNIEWYTWNGTGTFDDIYSLHPTYFPGTEDYINGYIIIGVGAVRSNETWSDEMTLVFEPVPEVYAGLNVTIQAGTDYPLSEAYALNFESLTWTSSGDGSFNYPAALHPVYHPGAQDRLNGFVELCLEVIPNDCQPVSSCLELTILPQSLFSDSLALVALYNATNGPNWTNHNNWLSGPINSWYGITVTNGRVTEILLYSNNLSGSIPGEIGDLSQLISLNFNDNLLMGSIPPEIGNLTSLQGLYLSYNQLTGSIPEEIGNLMHLVNLIGSYNQFSGNIPVSLGNLSFLQAIYLNNNLLTGSLPAEIGFLYNLQQLYIYDNQLTGDLPPEIGNLQNLLVLYIENNLFTGSIPIEICNIPTLISFNGSSNYFDMGSCPAIGCLIDNGVEISIGLQLNLLDLSTCIPSELSINIELEEDQICKGTSSYAIGMVTAFNYDSIQWTTTNGTGTYSDPHVLNPVYYPSANDFQQGWIQLKAEVFRNSEFASDSMVLGFVPGPVAEAGADDTIYAEQSYVLGNAIAGNYSSLQWHSSGDGFFNVAGITNPEYFPGTADMVNGTVQLCLTALPNQFPFPPCPEATSCMYLTIQPSQGNPDSLALVALYNATNGPNWTNKTNWLTGPLDTWYGVTVSDGFVTYVHLPNNNLTGVLPPEIGNLSHLEYLYLYNNHLSGSIPPETGNLASLELLHLYSNALTGTVPPEIGNLSNLLNLSISENQLSGSLPGELGNLSNLRDFDVSDNLFSGTIPLSLCNLENLLDFYYYYNYFDLSSCPAISCLLNHRVYLGAGIQHNGYDLSSDCNITVPVEIGVESETVCMDGSPYYLGNTTASGYNTVFWYVEFGTGYFDDPNSLHPSYFPSEDDYLNGSCMLVVRVTGDYGWAEDAMWLYFQDCNNLLDIGTDFDYTCFPQGYFFGNTMIPNNFYLSWSTSGTGFFDCPYCENPVYYPGTEDLAMGSVQIEVCIMDEMWMWHCDNMTLFLQAPPESFAGEDIQICEDWIAELNGSAQNYSSVTWTTEGDGDFNDASQLNPQYTPGGNDLATGSVSLILTAYPAVPCDVPAMDTLIINLDKNTAVNILPDIQTICYGDSFDFTGLVEASDYDQVVWFSVNGGGSYNNEMILEPIYYPNPAIDYQMGCVELDVVLSPLGVCTVPAFDFMTLCFQPPPVAEAGADTTLCGQADLQLNGSVSNSDNHKWTTSGDGHFSDSTLVNPVYSPGASDIVSGSVILYLTAEPVSPCTTPVTDNLTIQFMDRPVAWAGNDTAVCDSWIIELSQAYAENYATVAWETSGDGYFSDPAVLNPDYYVGYNDLVTGNFTLCLTASGQPTCVDSISCINISIAQSPYAYAGEDAEIIGENSFHLESADAWMYSSILWNTSGDGWFDNPNMLDAIYYAGPVDITNQCVELTLTAIATDPCSGIAQDNIELCFRSLVENVTAFQTDNGSGLIIINYDLVYKLPFVNIVPEVSFNGGQSFQVLNNVAGETGINIPPGNHKFIYWYTHGDIPPTSTDSAIFRITATVPDWQCSQPVTDSRDSSTYNTVRIGSQCWMKENMNLGTRIPGNTNQTDNQTVEKYCYNNLETNCDVYGGLYQWDEMMQYNTAEGSQGICPPGWHIPKMSDWMTLKSFLGGAIVAGGKMKEEGTAHWNLPNTDGTNSSGFSGLPAGFCDNGSFTGAGNYAYFWLSMLHNDPSAAWYFNLFYNSAEVIRDIYYRSGGFSVRCIHDDTYPITRPIISVDTNVSASLNSAYIFANAIYDGGAPVTARGICWNTTGNPTVYDYKTVEGTATGYFFSHLTNLSPETQYYAKAYATNIAGTSYSEEITFFTTSVSLPSVGTRNITKKTPGSAQTGGEVYYDGGGQVTDRGVCWSTSANPTISDNYTSSGSGIGSFVIKIDGLEPNTTYYVRAFATNSAGTAYGGQFQFKTLIGGAPCPGAATITDIDGNIYHTVLIGNQCWMAENLNTTKYRNGTGISHPGTNNTQWQNNTTGAYAYYNQDLLFREKYGLLYNRYAVNNVNGLCPTGWHVPSRDEWDQLVSYVNSGYPTGQVLKSCRQVNSPLGGDCSTQWIPRWDEHETCYGTDVFGFSGLPGGYRSYDGNYDRLGKSGSWWSAYDVNTQLDWIRILSYDSNYLVFGYNLYLAAGRSVRCIKD